MLASIYRRFKKYERATVVLVAIVAGGCWGFVEIADEVVEGETAQLDRQALLAMRNPADPSDPLGPGWMEEAARDVTSLGGVVVLVFFTAAATGYLLLTRQNWVALFVAASITSGTLASLALKSGYDRPRPDLVPHATEVYTRSFPSGHSAMSALVFLTLGALLARVQKDRLVKFYLATIAVLLTIGVGLSRVYLGVHWPTDVLAGWLFGVTWAAASWLAFRWVEKRRRTNAAEPRK